MASIRRTPRSPGESKLPIPKTSKGSPGNAKSTLSKNGNQSKSSEDLPRRVQLSLAGSPSPQRRAVSPGGIMRKGFAPGSPGPVQNGQAGVRYITEDLIRKMCKEESLEMVTTVNLTLTKGEGGKKIKYIENLEKLKRVEVLILNNNIIEKMEKLDKLLKLKELSLADNCIVKIEGLENLTNLQMLNLTGNMIEHIPIWMGKRLKSLRTFHIGRNRLESLSELAKLKPLPDLTQLTVAKNPLSEFNHCRSYLIFHIRSLEVIDGENVTDRERHTAKDRFEQDELERLEKQLETEEAKNRRLEEEHNRSQQERHHLSATEDDLRKREKGYSQRIEELERQMQTKDDLLKKKTQELNRACEKHYQIEQDLAFHKIDSKFDSLGRGPEHSLDDTGDDGLLGESPYIGRARYKANRFADESSIAGATPNTAQFHSLPSPVRAEAKMEFAKKLDKEIAVKQDKVSKAEDRLKRLTDELQNTEDKLRNATMDLKGIGDAAVQDKEEQKQAIRQKMARKMRSVNEMKDSATQIEDEIEKSKNSLHQQKMDMVRLKDHLGRMDKKDPNYRRVYAEMVDKEQQINESNQMYGQLQNQLELMLDTVAKETNDIKRLEQQLNEDQIETNDSLREELDEIVGGLQSYLAEVQTKASKKEREFDQVLKEKEDLHGRVRKLEAELSVIDGEAEGLRDLERKYMDMEQSLRDQKDMNHTLQDQIHTSRKQDTQNQDYMETKEQEVQTLKRALKELEQKAKDPDFIQKCWSHSTSIHSSSSNQSKEGEMLIKQASSNALESSAPGMTLHKKQTGDLNSKPSSSLESMIIPHAKVNKMFPDLNSKDDKKQLEIADLKPTTHTAFKPLNKPKPNLVISKNEKHTFEKQLQTEKAKGVDGERKSKEAQKMEEDMRKLVSQLESVKAQNVALKEKVEQDTQTYQSRMTESTPNNELRRRLKDLSQSFKNSKVSIEPEGEKDVLGKTFKDLQGFVHDKLNKSFKDTDDVKNRFNKSDLENQSLRDQLKRAESKLEKRDEKVKNEKNKYRDELKSNQEEMRRLNEELQRLRNALKEARSRAKQTKIVHDEDNESMFSRRSSLNTEEKHLFDELQNELIALKRAMRNKEEDATKKIIDAETEAAMLEQKLDDQEESYQNEIKALKDHMDLQKERQEARMQVIATDLDQAQQVADVLQGMLDTREQQLHAEVNQADLSTQMITGQEDELAKLYDILEVQRDEIGKLNGMLDNLSGEGMTLGTSGADDELWRLRTEVNNLKETLAMQSAYVQTMPPPHTSAGVQANTGTGTQYYLSDQGTAAGPVYKPILSQYREQPLSMVPPVPGMASMGTHYAPPGYGTQGVGVGSGAGGSPLGGGSPIIGAGGAGGPEQQEVITPPGGRPSTGTGRSRPTQLPIKRHASRGVDADNDRLSETGRSGRSRDSRGRRKERGREKEGQHRDSKDTKRSDRRREEDDGTNMKTAFEPVYRPEPHRPLMSGAPVNVYSTPEGVVMQPAGALQTGSQMVAPHGGQMVAPPGGQMGGTGVTFGGVQSIPYNNYNNGIPVQGQGTGPMLTSSGTYPSTGYQQSGLSPVRGQTIFGAGTQSGFSVGPAQTMRQGTNTQGYMIPQGYTIPPHPGMATGAPAYNAGIPAYNAGIPAQSSGMVPGYAGTQTPGYGTTQTSGMAGNQAAPGYASIPTHSQGPSVAMGPSPGGPTAYTGPAQAVAYNSGRVFVPAYPTGAGKPPARVYYDRGSGGGGGGGDGGGGGYAPYGGSRSMSPDGRARFLPVEPLAQGTPIRGHTMPRTGQAPMPSPIRAVTGGHSPVRGGNMAQTTGATDETYLFCNVPEHHDLEDYIAELQEKLRKLRARIANEKGLQAEMQDDKDYSLIRRLQGELSERRDELEGLDLAIERQQKNLKNLKSEEKQLHFEREVAKEDLDFLRGQNAMKKKKTRVYDDEDSFDERMDNSRKKLLRDEIRCLEETLAKRKSQLREADRLLKECNTDLKCARDEARVTVREYDKAAHGLETTVKETGELEKRANIAGIELIKASEKLNAIRRETKDYESKRSKQERLLRDVTQLITKRDSDFKDLDNRSKATQQNLSRLQNELAAASQKERETVTALRESEDVLGKRRNEIARMRDQIDQQKLELEKVDHMMGKKRTELQFLQEGVDRKQAEINQLIRDTETELSANKRELKEQRDLLRSMEVQKSELGSNINNKRAELQKLKEDVETEDEVLQKLTNAVSKNKSELKHTFEMQRLEQTELDNLKSQHAQKLAELERTQRELLDEKNDLEQMNSEMNKKSSEVERLRGIIERDRMESERLALEKQSYEDRISTMTREKDLLDETYKTMDTKIMQLKRSQNTMEEKVDSTSRRLQTLESELLRREREMEEMDRQKAHRQKDLTLLKDNVKEGKHELKILKEQVRDAENKIALMEQELRDSHTQRDEAKLEMERLNEQIRQSRMTHDDCIRQQRQREEELQDLIRTMDEREMEYQDTRKSLNKVRKEVEKEESKLSKLVSTANKELDHIRSDLNSKQNELAQATTDMYSLKKEAEKMELDEHKLSEYENKIRDLKQEVQDRNEEKNELAKALTRSYEELQKLRTQSAQEQERLTVDRMQLENTLRDLQDQLDQNKRELNQMQKRSNAQVTELQALAEEQFSRANKLSEELARMKTKKTTDQSQTGLTDVTNQIAGDNKSTSSPDEPTKQSFNQTPQKSEHSLKSRDKGEYPSQGQSVTFEPKFREFLDLANTPPEFHLRETGYPVFEHSFRIQDPNLSLPSADSSFKTPDSSPIQSSRSKFDMAMRKSPQTFTRDRALTPPSTWDRNVSLSPDRRPDTSMSPPPPFSRNVLDHGLVPPPKRLSDIEESSRSMTQTDTSSTMTSPPVTQRDIGSPVPSSRQPLTGHAHRGPSPLVTGHSPLVTGHSPPVKDGSIPSLSLSMSARDRLTFDLGFLDILTVDSNSSVVDQISTGRLTDPQSDNNKENLRSSAEELRKTDATFRETLAKEQEVLRLQLKQQMERHADAMEQARLHSEGNLENLRKKLNTLQDVLVTSTDLSSPTFHRTRSRSAGLVPSPDRKRSPSPGYGHHGYLAQRPRSRSRSADRVSRSLFPDREFLTV